jgi:hypothetical protein
MTKFLLVAIASTIFLLNTAQAENSYCRYFVLPTIKTIEFSATESKKETWPLYTRRAKEQYVPANEVYLDLEIINKGEIVAIKLTARKENSPSLAYDLQGLVFKVQDLTTGKMIREKDFDFTDKCTRSGLRFSAGAFSQITETEIDISHSEGHIFVVSISSQGGE